MSTPSAPLAKAFNTNWTSTRPEHITRTTSALAAYLMREVPARSAARYVHQLQKKATILGSNSSGLGFKSSGIAQNTLDFRKDFVILKEVLPDSPGRTGSHAGAAALAEHLVDAGFVNFVDEGNGAIGAHGNAGLAAAADGLFHVGGVGLGFHVAGVDERQG